MVWQSVAGEGNRQGYEVARDPSKESWVGLDTDRRFPAAYAVTL
jgi:hypothetical protein